jgi:hypothetical protein
VAPPKQSPPLSQDAAVRWIRRRSRPSPPETAVELEGVHVWDPPPPDGPGQRTIGYILTLLRTHGEDNVPIVPHSGGGWRAKGPRSDAASASGRRRGVRVHGDVVAPNVADVIDRLTDKTSFGVFRLYEAAVTTPVAAAAVADPPTTAQALVDAVVAAVRRHPDRRVFEIEAPGAARWYALLLAVAAALWADRRRSVVLRLVDVRWRPTGISYGHPWRALVDRYGSLSARALLRYARILARTVAL